LSLLACRWIPLRALGGGDPGSTSLENTTALMRRARVRPGATIAQLLVPASSLLLAGLDFAGGRVAHPFPAFAGLAPVPGAWKGRWGG